MPLFCRKKERFERYAESEGKLDDSFHKYRKQMINIREIRQRHTHVLNDHLTDSKSNLGQGRNVTFLAQSSALRLGLSVPRHKTRNLRMRCNDLFLDIPRKTWTWMASSSSAQ